MTGAQRIEDFNAFDGWELPAPLSAEVEPPPFPMATLPPWLGTYAGALAITTQTPPDMAGSLILAMLAAVTARRVVVEPRPGWIEPTNLYVAVLMPPAERKTAVFSNLTRPIRDLEAELIESTATDRTDTATERTILEKRQKAATELAAKAECTEDRVRFTEEAQTLAAELAGLEVPAEPCLIVDESTPEHLRKTLVEQGGRLAQMADEGGPFDLLTRYSKDGAAQLDTYLKGHAADTPIKAATLGRGTETVDRPTLTVAMAVQPAMFDKVAKVDGTSSRGFLARFLWVKPVSLVGLRAIDPPAMIEAVANKYRDELIGLARFLDKLPGASPLTLTLDAGARELFDKFRGDLEPRLSIVTGDLAYLEHWPGKLPGAIARIAGLLHVAGHWHEGIGTPINAATMQHAIELGEYFLAHALNVLGALGTDPATAKAVAMLAVIRRKRLDSFTAAELWRDHLSKGRGHFTTTDDRDDALRILTGYGWLRLEGKTYEVYPGA